MRGGGTSGGFKAAGWGFRVGPGARRWASVQGWETLGGTHHSDPSRPTLGDPTPQGAIPSRQPSPRTVLPGTQSHPEPPRDACRSQPEATRPLPPNVALSCPHRREPLASPHLKLPSSDAATESPAVPARCRILKSAHSL
ncbi:hypothetical protein GUJ93_ZPchr0005g15024 [Zizania palustris]|uniref:Uncharacterized protein n=1 Tax=Zizania palustris TaxID=103762 RepID=A0A8J5S550_ZIZPA|nr:hypothetical protein GUJ93_ZPchr0005g15024 [Zizania palustris]